MTVQPPWYNLPPTSDVDCSVNLFGFDAWRRTHICLSLISIGERGYLAARGVSDHYDDLFRTLHLPSKII